MRWINVHLLAGAALVILVAACANPPTSQLASAKEARAQLLFRISENDGKTDRPVRVRVILRSRTGRAYDVSHSFPAEASGADIATFFERSFNGCGFKAFRSTNSVFVAPVYEFGANCSHDCVEVTFGGTSADLVKSVPVAKPEPPGEGSDGR